jgi:hypothetical protein
MLCSGAVTWSRAGRFFSLMVERNLLGRVADPHLGLVGSKEPAQIEIFPDTATQIGGPDEGALTGLRFSLIWLHPIPRW